MIATTTISALVNKHLKWSKNLCRIRCVFIFSISRSSTQKFDPATQDIAILLYKNSFEVDVQNASLNDMAKCFAVDVPTAAGKMTTVNPKYDIIHSTLQSRVSGCLPFLSVRDSGDGTRYV